MPLKNPLWIKLWLCLLDNENFMEKLSDAEKWYYCGMLLLYAKWKSLENDGKKLGKKLTKDGQDIAQNVENIIKIMHLRVKKGRIYIPNFKKYNPYIWKDSGIPKRGKRELPEEEGEEIPSSPSVSPQKLEEKPPEIENQNYTEADRKRDQDELAKKASEIEKKESPKKKQIPVFNHLKWKEDQRQKVRKLKGQSE